MKVFLQRYGLLIAWAGLLFVLSSIPDLQFPVEVFSWDDKIQHVLAYTPLGWLFLRAIVWKKPFTRRALWLAILAGALYGATDELHQYFVPGRAADWTDWLADTIGVASGAWLFYRWRGRFTPSHQIKPQEKSKNRGKKCAQKLL
ncbi:MAG: VanZ family protein [candidate division KSB1 bacterium]|nr:VanZ family protein [candidate division KSB1 bacterium]MDZ7364586.1 VanZ family protein [candidate division KSB1 bacterium]MDZ7402666.1 VanZ family protein [candidate division KSB1 bacterium]